MASDASPVNHFDEATETISEVGGALYEGVTTASENPYSQKAQVLKDDALQNDIGFLLVLAVVGVISWLGPRLMAKKRKLSEDEF